MPCSLCCREFPRCAFAAWYSGDSSPGALTGTDGPLLSNPPPSRDPTPRPPRAARTPAIAAAPPPRRETPPSSRLRFLAGTAPFPLRAPCGDAHIIFRRPRLFISVPKTLCRGLLLRQTGWHPLFPVVVLCVCWSREIHPPKTTIVKRAGNSPILQEQITLAQLVIPSRHNVIQFGGPHPARARRDSLGCWRSTR